MTDLAIVDMRFHCTAKMWMSCAVSVVYTCGRVVKVTIRCIIVAAGRHEEIVRKCHLQGLS
jgi:hypothetical protein